MTAKVTVEKFACRARSHCRAGIKLKTLKMRKNKERRKATARHFLCLKVSTLISFNRVSLMKKM
jgi:hypothetical protein